jgi:hypothetical protein
MDFINYIKVSKPNIFAPNSFDKIIIDASDRMLELKNGKIIK